MKSLAAGLAILTCLGLSACAGTSGPNGIARESNMDSSVDVGKVVAVNQWALQRGARVVWINYPTLADANTDG
jgi:starvation-inducible outer membrane lipoprotein